MSLTTRQSRMLGTSDGAAATVAPAVLLPRSVWTSQPQQVADVVPQYADSVFYVASESGFNSYYRGQLIRRNKEYSSGTPSRYFCKQGIGLAHPTSNSLYAKAVNTKNTNYTYFSVANVLSTAPASPSIILCSSNGSVTLPASYQVAVLLGTDGNYHCIVHTDVDISVPATLGVHTFHVTYIGTSVNFYVDGMLVGSATTASNNYILNACYPMSYNSGGNYVIGTQVGKVAILMAGMFGTVLPTTTIKELGVNPWQIFRPLNRQVWVAA